MMYILACLVQNPFAMWTALLDLHGLEESVISTTPSLLAVIILATLPSSVIAKKRPTLTVLVSITVTNVPALKHDVKMKVCFGCSDTDMARTTDAQPRKQAKSVSLAPLNKNGY